MSKLFSVRGWRVQLGWQGLTITRPEPVDRYREIKLAAWMQATDAFVPGGLWLAEAPLRRITLNKNTKPKARRGRIS